MIFRKFIDLLYLDLVIKTKRRINLPFPVLTIRRIESAGQSFLRAHINVERRDSAPYNFIFRQTFCRLFLFMCAHAEKINRIHWKACVCINNVSGILQYLYDFGNLLLAFL